MWEPETWAAEVFLPAVSQVWETCSKSCMLNNALPCHWSPWIFPCFCSPYLLHWLPAAVRVLSGALVLLQLLPTEYVPAHSLHSVTARWGISALHHWTCPQLSLPLMDYILITQVFPLYLLRKMSQEVFYNQSSCPQLKEVIYKVKWFIKFKSNQLIRLTCSCEFVKDRAVRA